MAAATENRDHIEVTGGDILRGLRGIGKDWRILAGVVPNMIPRPLTRTESVGKTFQEAAAKYSDRPFLRFHGESMTYRECNAQVNRFAAFLADRGIGRGDVVAILAKNHPDVVLCMLATVKLGAIAGMINYHQRGNVLQHSLGLIDAKILLVQPGLEEAVESVPATALPSAIVDFDDLKKQSALFGPTDPAVTDTVQAGETAYYIFTSGTTGYPKASKMSHHRWHVAMHGIGGMGVRLRPEDTMYAALPFYHNNALTISVSAAIRAGACVAVGEQFSASGFWDDIILNKATAFCYIGELCRYLLAQPEKPTDRTHSVRVMVGNGLRPEIWDEFTERFGIDRVAELYAASEGNIGFVNLLGIPKSAGFSPLTYAIVEFDEESGEPRRDGDGRVIPVGKHGTGLLLGEINERAHFDGYTDPKASEKKVVGDAVKPGDRWFNTGDVVHDQGFGHIAFVDRIGDTFRWKGENVATTEVEAALDSCDLVDQSVVFGVGVPGADGKAGMAAVLLADGARFDPDALAEHVRETLPRYAIPLFIRIVDHLEHTSTFKNVRTGLRNEGYTDTGDDPVFVLRGNPATYEPYRREYLDDVIASAGAKVSS
ncbi:long-chain-acyl-CoA synthetase [Gordonia sp. SID5947]|uniref:long-chain-acyl-CoA synthetase n=1 Tax=Gordonia sp. SID5947 TaxID=2690315 RepID=UPI001367BD74|nr:long-chain-acyl-CoA synthetase [Gordonia sp. SID5947]MYR04865.1 long-chain-acyl-CoA synthetase [Gordonia sp. SID5947]